MLQIGNVSAGFRFQTVYRGCCGDVKRVVLRIAPGQIRGLFRHDDRAKMISIRVPHPDAFWSRHEQVSLNVNFDAIRNALALSSGLFSENPSAAEGSIAAHGVDADVALLTVIDVELLAIGREG